MQREKDENKETRKERQLKLIKKTKINRKKEKTITREKDEKRGS